MTYNPWNYREVTALLTNVRHPNAGEPHPSAVDKAEEDFNPIRHGKRNFSAQKSVLHLRTGELACWWIFV